MRQTDGRGRGLSRRVQRDQERFASVRRLSHGFGAFAQSRRCWPWFVDSTVEHAGQRGHFANLAQLTPILPARLTHPGAARNTPVDHAAQQEVGSTGPTVTPPLLTHHSAAAMGAERASRAPTEEKLLDNCMRKTAPAEQGRRSELFQARSRRANNQVGRGETGRAPLRSSQAKVSK